MEILPVVSRTSRAATHIGGVVTCRRDHARRGHPAGDLQFIAWRVPPSHAVNQQVLRASCICICICSTASADTSLFL